MGRGVNMSELLELDNIQGLVLSIEYHWDFLLGNYPDWSPMPGVLLAPGFMRRLCENRWKDELLRRKLRLDPAFQCPAWQILDTLQSAMFTRVKSEDPIKQMIAQGVAQDAYQLAKKSMTEALTKAELNELGWLLTRLVAMSVAPIKEALRNWGQAKGGIKSGEMRRVESVDRDLAICAAGRQLLTAGRSFHSLAGIISRRSESEGLSEKRVREILRIGGVLPALKKKGS